MKYDHLTCHRKGCTEGHQCAKCKRDAEELRKRAQRVEAQKRRKRKK